VTLKPVNLALTSKPDPDLKRAHEELRRIQADSREVIRIMSAEEALKAQRVVREAGRRGR
jgi:hypothetical protein